MDGWAGRVYGRAGCAIQWGPMLLLLFGLSGCVAQPDHYLLDAMANGQYGRARVYMTRIVATQPRPRDGFGRDLDRAYVLNRMRLALLTLADGYLEAGDRVCGELYDVLRTQGINRDKTITSVVLNEDLKTWKGEPFEQAMAFHYVSVHHAQRGQWDNARAAADNALFHLRDFGERRDGRPRSNEDLVKEALRDDQYLDHGYVAVETDFALGHLMHGIASSQIDRDREAQDHFNRAVALNGRLRPLVDRFAAGDYNLVLVVDFGRGPRKIGTGPDNAIATFATCTTSDDRPLRVSIGGREAFESHAAVCDLNALARDHRWNSLEDLRLAKSHIGTGLMLAGAFMTAHGGDHDDRDVQFAGLGMMVAGALAKAGAHADTRYCEVMPQRTYVVPLKMPAQEATITLQVEGLPASRMVLAAVRAPRAGDPAGLRYVRLLTAGGAAPSWAAEGRIHYANDATPAAVRSNLPYVLGGNCVRPPTEQVLRDYQSAGFLRDFSLGRLEDLYREEGIRTQPRTPLAQPGRHVLEGGNSLVAPAAGTTGFARIFGRAHGPYTPRSPRVRSLAEQLRRRSSPQETVATFGTPH